MSRCDRLLQGVNYLDEKFRLAKPRPRSAMESKRSVLSVKVRREPNRSGVVERAPMPRVSY